MQHEKSGRLDNSPFRHASGTRKSPGCLLSTDIGPRTDTDIHPHNSHRYLYSGPRGHTGQSKPVGRTHEGRRQNEPRPRREAGARRYKLPSPNCFRSSRTANRGRKCGLTEGTEGHCRRSLPSNLRSQRNGRRSGKSRCQLKPRSLRSIVDSVARQNLQALAMITLDYIIPDGRPKISISPPHSINGCVVIAVSLRRT